MDFKEVLDFWFHGDSKKWFSKDIAFDDEITSKFQATYFSALRAELFNWRRDPKGRLAEIIVLDQFPRNMFRNSPQAFAGDALALVLAQEAIAQKVDATLSAQEKSFLYMPFMHSESLLVHKEALLLFSAAGLEENLEYEKMHMKIIERFGRYPHRNKILGRESSPEEVEFLKGPNSSF